MIDDQKQLASKTHFECLKCGNCCQENGYVYTTTKDISKISEFLHLSIKNFRKKYTRKTNNRIALKGEIR